MKYYQHHIGDYRKDTAHLSLLEHGIYRQLLDLYYDREGHIEYDLKRISRLISVRTKKERDLLKNVVEDFFVEKNGFLFQRRCEKEIVQLYDKSEKARQSALIRWGKVNDANAMRTHSGCNARDDANDMLPINPLTHKPINPKKNNKKPLSKPSDIEQSIWDDFICLRKTKKAPLTKTALTGIRNQAKKAGISLGEALSISCERGWTSFKADWNWQDSSGQKVDYMKGVLN